MRVECEVEIERDDAETGEVSYPTLRLVAVVEGENVTILEPSDYRYLTPGERRQLFDAACNEVERQERAQARVKALVDELLGIGRAAGGAF